MRYWLLICISFANSLFAQDVDLSPKKNIRIPIQIQNLILGSDSTDFRGFFHDSVSIFAIKFDALRTYKDSAGIHITTGTGSNWHMGQITTFRYELYPLQYLDSIGYSDQVDISCNFIINIIEDSGEYSGIAVCKGYIGGALAKGKIWAPAHWKYEYRVDGYWSSYSTISNTKRSRVYWSYTIPKLNSESTFSLNDRNSETAFGPKDSWGKWISFSTFKWPRTTMVPPENWYKTE